MGITLDVRWRMGARQDHEFQPEFFALLQEIESSGSLFTAARTLGLSYRYAWGLVREWSRRMGQPVAELQRGRGTKLTPLGTRLLWGQKRISARLGPELESLASEVNSEIAAMVKSPSHGHIRAFASHGLALGILRDLVNAQPDFHLDLQFRGSLESLRLFRSGKCDIAGFHFPYGELARHIVGRYRSLLVADQHALIHVVNREQGLITAPGNPRKILAMADLARPDVVFINREPASGTRLLLDALLGDAGIDPASVHGYDNEEFTHTAVAATVASGAADAGFGIKAAAIRLGLAFSPMVRERYLFAVRREALEGPALTHVRGVLQSEQFRTAAAALPGYDPADAGTLLVPEVLLP